jgi:hypothetical protein
LLPTEGVDAAGTDIEDVWRPRGAQRLLSVHEVLAPSSLVVYRAPRREPEQLIERYRRQLTDAGWTLVERHEGESIRIDGVSMLAATKKGRLTTVLAESANAGNTRLILLESRASR